MEYEKVYLKKENDNFENFCIEFVQQFSKELNFQNWIDDYGKEHFKIKVEEKEKEKVKEVIKISDKRLCKRVKVKEDKKAGI